ncbi:hypothetical protein N9W17_05660 [Jannaschia sp.]|nr:hypothetical protein [Jannaschia sp.]
MPVNDPNPRIDGNPDITSLEGGRSAISYQSRLEDDTFDIVVRLREADGTLGDEFRPEGDWTVARDADVTALSDGTFLLSWLAETTEGGQARTNVFGQRLSATGEALSPATSLLSQARSEGRFDTQLVFADPDGGFAVNGNYGSRGESDAAVFSSNDIPSTPGIASNLIIPDEGAGIVDTSAFSGINSSNESEFTVLSSGELIAVENTGQANVVSARLSDPGARYTGDPFYSPLHVIFPSVSSEDISVIEDSSSAAPSTFSTTALADGGFIVVWSVLREISAQLFDADGQQLGDNYSIGTSGTSVPGPEVAEVGDGEFLFVWQDVVDGNIDVVSTTVSRDEIEEGEFSPLPIASIQAYGTIAGFAQEGELLRVSGSIDSAYSVSNVSLQWFRVDSSIRTPIEGATGRNLTLTQDEVGNLVILEATIEDATGHTVSEDIYLRYLDFEGFPFARVQDIPGPTEGADTLFGGTGNNVVDGQGGDDRIDGGIGRDTLTGGDGADVFVFASGSGADTITDFEIGSDRVEFDFDGISRVRELVRSTDVSQEGDDVVIDFGDGDVLTLLGVQKGDLSGADAIFV